MDFKSESWRLLRTLFELTAVTLLWKKKLTLAWTGFCSLRIVQKAQWKTVGLFLFKEEWISGPPYLLLSVQDQSFLYHKWMKMTFLKNQVFFRHPILHDRLDWPLVSCAGHSQLGIHSDPNKREISSYQLEDSQPSNSCNVPTRLLSDSLLTLTGHEFLDGLLIHESRNRISHLSNSHSLVGGHHSCFGRVGTDGWLGVWVASLSPDMFLNQ